MLWVNIFHYYFFDRYAISGWLKVGTNFLFLIVYVKCTRTKNIFSYNLLIKFLDVNCDYKAKKAGKMERMCLCIIETNAIISVKVLFLYQKVFFLSSSAVDTQNFV